MCVCVCVCVCADESNSVCGSDDTGAVSYTTAKERLGDGGMECEYL